MNWGKFHPAHPKCTFQRAFKYGKLKLQGCISDLHLSSLTVTLCMLCTLGHSTGSKRRGFNHNPQQLKDYHCKFSSTWNIPLSRMLLYAKSKIPVLPTPNRSQFEFMSSRCSALNLPSRTREGRRPRGFHCTIHTFAFITHKTHRWEQSVTLVPKFTLAVT